MEETFKTDFHLAWRRAAAAEDVYRMHRLENPYPLSLWPYPLCFDSIAGGKSTLHLDDFPAWLSVKFIA
jgi:hypothetical protein